MAKSMTNIKRMEIPKEVQIEKDVEEIKEALSENKHAILEGIKLLKSLDDADMLQAMYAITNHRKEAMGKLATELNKAQYSGVIENLTGFLFLLGDLDVDAIRNLSDRINRGMEETEKEPESKTGFMDLAKALKDPEINRSVTMLMQFLKGMGRD